MAQMRDAKGRFISSKSANIQNTRLEWAPDFEARTREDFSKKQKFVDNEVLRLSDPLIPLKTGTLKNSGIRSTKIGSGVVTYNTPYAHYQYYSTAETRSYDPRRGAKWFERMKAAHGRDILEGAKKI